MRPKIPEKIEELLQETKYLLKNIFTNNFVTLVLYGSYARGDYREDSDIDILLILNNVKSYPGYKNKYLEVLSDLWLKYNKVISVIPLSKKDYDIKHISLIINVKKEGIEI